MNVPFIPRPPRHPGGITALIRCMLPCLLAAFFVSCNGVARAEDAIAKSAQIISRYKATFDAPPKQVPSFHAVDGPITGNGDIGLTVSGPPAHQRYWISKDDFWKSGPDFKQCGPSLIGGIDVCKGRTESVAAGGRKT